jgi:hypothetical protein
VTPRSLPRHFRSFAAEALDLTWARPTVISVSDGSPAAQAGIRDHDELVALNGELISVTGTANWMGGWLKANGDKPLRVDLRRDAVLAESAVGDAQAEGDVVDAMDGCVIAPHLRDLLATLLGRDRLRVEIGQARDRRAAGGDEREQTQERNTHTQRQPLPTGEKLASASQPAQA